MTSFSATMTRRGALGLVEAAYDLNGCDETMASAFDVVLNTMTPGDRAEISLTRNLPTGHPLIGISLDVPGPDVVAPRAGESVRTVDGTHTIPHGHEDLERMRREELRDAHFALVGTASYARRTLAELGHHGSGPEREAGLIKALQHIQAHCDHAVRDITTVDVDQSTRRGTQ